MTCPSEERIAAFIDGGLSQGERDVIETHLAKCDWCREVVAIVAQYRDDDTEAQEEA